MRPVESYLQLGRWHGLAWRGHRTGEWTVKLGETKRRKPRITKKIPEPTNTKSQNLAKELTKPSQEMLTSVATQLHHESGVGSRDNQDAMTVKWARKNTPGVEIPPAAKFTTGSRFNLAVSFRRWNGA